WVLAVLSNLPALQRILFTRRAMAESPTLRTSLLVPLVVLALATPATADTSRAPRVAPETERAWAGAIAAPVERRGDLPAARTAAVAVADRHKDSRLAPRALLAAATLAMRAGDDA